MHMFFQELKQGSQALGLELSDEALNLLLKYQDALVLWNKAYNLTAIRDPKEMNAQRKSRDEIASALSVKPFVAGKLSDQARAFPIRTLKEAIRYAVELEEAVKSGDLLDTMAVELLIFRMTVKK